MKECKHCGYPPETESRDLGNQCRICKNGMYRYGMNRLDMIALHESQDKLCFLCDKEVILFNGTAGGVVDHCHTHGKVRAILCQKCNDIVGKVESHANVSRVLEYIKK